MAFQILSNAHLARATRPITDAWRSFSQKRRALRSKWRLWDAKKRRLKSKATFIAVTGSSGKSTTVKLLAHILSGDDQTTYQLLANGLREAVTTTKQLQPSDKYAVFECGTARPGDIRPIAELLKPSVSIVTLVAIEHYSAFRTQAAIAQEKSELVQGLSAGELAVLNFDDPHVRAMAEKTKGRVVGFGKENGDYRVSNLRLSPEGQLSLTIRPPASPPLQIKTALLGTYHWVPVAAAVTCALELGISADLIVARIASFEAIHGRMSVHQIPNGPRFILDTAKAPWFSLMLPLEVMREIRAPRKRIIFGHISDYAGNPRSKHRDACHAALEFADEVMLVGPNSHRFSAKDEVSSPGRFRAFPTVKECAEYVRRSAIEGEVILLKSSLNIHLDRIWLNFVEDVHCWPTVCGLKDRICFECLPRVPFHEHGARDKYPRRPPYQRRLTKAPRQGELVLLGQPRDDIPS